MEAVYLEADTADPLNAKRLDNDCYAVTANPSTGVAFAQVRLGSEAELHQSIESAKKALPNWQRDLETRRRLLELCANDIGSNSEELAALIVGEQGKPIAEAREEVSYARSLFHEYATMELPDRLLGKTDHSQAFLRYQPIGIVGLLTPWNFPIATAAVKLAPALLMGNAVVFKPSERAPSAPMKLAMILAKRLPKGILSAFAGKDELGDAMACHPDIGKISVTGSIETGRRAMASASSNLKRLTLELGGNDPAIVLPDADPETVAKSIVSSAFRNAGQVCNSIKRLYVHRSIEDELCHRLRQEIENLKVGCGMDPSTDIGPLTLLSSLSRLDRLVKDALQNGGKLHCGGKRINRPGFFFEPTLISNLTNGMPLVDEEQFGPILPIISYSNYDHAIEMANRSPYGLSASVWTSNTNLGIEISHRLKCGRVGVNGHKRGDISAPFGGFKQSGIGRELGEWGLCGMAEMQVVNVFET